MLIVMLLLIAAVLGYLAQRIGLCMVHGVRELSQGKPLFLVATLCCGLWVWVAAFISTYVDKEIPFHNYDANIWFVVGGLVFGLGTAMNNGCAVSTLNRLTQGDTKMLATMIGWLLGWYILALWPLHKGALTNSPVPEYLVPLLITASLTATIWAVFFDKSHKKIWLSLMAIGLLAGILMSFEPDWSPSGLLRDVSIALLNPQSNNWPDIDRYLIMVALLVGMTAASLRAHSFNLSLPKFSSIVLHLIAGVMMGVGGAMALGGNDSQLLLSLPTLSGGGIVAVLSIILGIYLGLEVQKRLVIAQP